MPQLVRGRFFFRNMSEASSSTPTLTHVLSVQLCLHLLPRSLAAIPAEEIRRHVAGEEGAERVSAVPPWTLLLLRMVEFAGDEPWVTRMGMAVPVRAAARHGCVRTCFSTRKRAMSSSIASLGSS
jgi:hypothetical protein